MKIPHLFQNFLGNLLNQLRLKDTFREDFRQLRGSYPLYQLAPAADRGTRLIRLDRIFNFAGRSAQDSNIIHYPRQAGLLASLLSLFGLETRRDRKPAVQIIKIENRCFVARGRLGARLAALFGYTCLPAQVIEYDYAALKKKIWVLLRRDCPVACVSGPRQGKYLYHRLSPAELKTLLQIHRVPCVDLRASAPPPPPPPPPPSPSPSPSPSTAVRAARAIPPVPAVPAGRQTATCPLKRSPFSGSRSGGDSGGPEKRQPYRRRRTKVVPLKPPPGRLPGAGGKGNPRPAI